MLGSLLIGTGAMVLGGTSLSYFAQKLKKNTGKIEVEAEYVDRTPFYTQLFENLGLIKTDKGDWIKCYEVKRLTNYRLVKFKISDTLSCSTFKKATTELEEKMLTAYKGENYKNKLHVYMDKGYMYFRVLNEKIDLIPYQFKYTKKYLIPLGTDLDDNIVYWNLKKDPHIKVIGATGSGKSRQMQIIITHIFYNLPGAPLWLLDFKNGAELGPYANTKNVVAYAQDLDEAKYVLKSFKDEYKRRMDIITKAGYRNFDDYTAATRNSKMKRGFLIIDEFADLMDLNEKATKEKEGYDAIKELIDIARKVRAAGLHCCLGTQRPTADSIPSSMKNNITATIGMTTENELNSRLIVDMHGCELLEQSHSICRLESKIVHARSFCIEDEVMLKTAKEFAKPKDEKQQQQEQPKKKIKKGSNIK